MPNTIRVPKVRKDGIVQNYAINPDKEASKTGGGRVAGISSEPARGVATTGAQSSRDYAQQMSGINKDSFSRNFTPESIFANADRIEKYMGIHGIPANPLIREALFEYASEEMSIAYDEFDDRWRDADDSARERITDGEKMYRSMLMAAQSGSNDYGLDEFAEGTLIKRRNFVLDGYNPDSYRDRRDYLKNRTRS